MLMIAFQIPKSVGIGYSKKDKDARRALYNTMRKDGFNTFDIWRNGPNQMFVRARKK